MELTQEQIKVLNFYADNQMKELKKICDPLIYKMRVANMDHDDLYSDALKVLEESVRSYREDKKCSFKTYLTGNIKRSFHDWQRDRLRWKRCNLQTDKDGKLMRDEKKNTIAIPNMSLDEPNEDDVNWNEKISVTNNTNDEYSEGLNRYLDSLSETELGIANLIIEGYSKADCQEILHIPEKKFQRILNNMKSFEKRCILNNNSYKEDKQMANTTNTMEKSKSDRLSISSIKKKIHNQIIRFNHPLQRESEQWTDVMKGNLISDILQGNPIPALTFAEQVVNGIAITWDLDGKQRCTNAYNYSNDGFKVSKKVRRGIIEYQAMLKNDNGELILDDDGFPQTEARTFDIRGKKFSELPEELQDKFMDYNFEIVQYLNCSSEDIAYHIARYNDGKQMNQQQKGIISLGEEFASTVKSISAMPFFKEMGNYTVRESTNGTINRVVVESIMSINFLDEWKKNQMEMCEFIKNNATEETFENFEDLVTRLTDIADDDTLEEFNSKDSFIWFGLFGRFVKTCDDDKKFIEFMAEYNQSLHKIFEDAEYDKGGKKKHSSKDKNLVFTKMRRALELMNEFLHIDTTEVNRTELENTYTEENKQNNTEESILSFVQENANPDATEEDIEFYKDMVEDCVRVDEPVYQQCENAVIAIMAYACMKEQDEEFEKWIQRYKNQTNFSPSQKTNFTYMKNSFDKYVQKGATA